MEGDEDREQPGVQGSAGLRLDAEAGRDGKDS